MNISEDDEAYLVWLDDAQAETKRKLKEWEAQIEREGGSDVALLETDAERLTALSAKIYEIEKRYDESAQAREPYLGRAIFLTVAQYEFLKGLRQRIRALQIQNVHPEYIQVTEQEISRAREYPLENLVDPDRQKRIICPFHEDKSPSIWVKNFGYCFSCGAWCDSIKYLMHVNGKSFIEAVKYLSGMARP